MTAARRAAKPLLLALAFAGGALPAFLLAFAAWPEIVTPAWFVTRGYRLYDAIFFPHTPLLILATAAAGSVAGFSATVFRAVAGLSSGLAAALLVASAPTPRARLGALLGGVPLLALQGTYLEGPALWPEPFLAPVPLAATLLLERWERRGRPRDLLLAALALGLGVLVKQTFAWFGLAALAWLLLASRRRSLRAAATLAAGIAAPYGAFVVLWGVAFGTTAHVRWTLLHVVFGGLGNEIAARPDLALATEAVAPFLALPALGLLRSALPGRRLRSPLAPLALAAAGMAWPRWGLLHLAAAGGLLVLAALRGARIVPALARRLSRRGASRRRELLAAAGTGLLLTNVAVAAVGAGPLLLDSTGGPARFWDDETSREWAQRAEARARPGGTLFVFDAPYETLYPRTGTTTPGGFYVNPSFWYCVDKDDVDARLVASLRGRPAVPILFREPPEGRDGDAVRATAIYRFLRDETELVERIDARASWRRAR
ncbi:MAG: glycosyltransferase family 39 protein [Thermoanaerobaculia bacterium]